MQTTDAPESYDYGRRRGKHEGQHNGEPAMRDHLERFWSSTIDRSHA
jgi:hypothetical protein